MELMWGLKYQMECLVPGEEPKPTNGYCLPMSEGMETVLDRHNFNVKNEIMVNKSIIEATGIVYECDRFVKKHSDSLRPVGEYLEQISEINSRYWDLKKLATALKMICYPEEKIVVAKKLFSINEYLKLVNDASKYEGLICKVACLEVYEQMLYARRLRSKALRRLVAFVKRAKEAYRADEAMKSHK